MMQEMCRKEEYIFYLVCKIGGIIINVANLEFFQSFYLRSYQERGNFVLNSGVSAAEFLNHSVVGYAFLQ